MGIKDSYNQKTAGVVRYSCGILFMLFVFCFLYFLQGEVLAQAQYVFSGGITEYSILVGAIIISVVLQIVQWVVQLLYPLPARFYSLSYVPSALILAILSSLDEESMLNFSFGNWTWIVPSVLFLYAVLAIAVNKIEEKSVKPFLTESPLYLYPNFIILLCAMICVGGLAKSTDVYQFELKTERLIMEKDYAAAAKVGYKSLRTSKRLNQLRMYALSQQDSLADCLFQYPQLYGSKGLLDISDTLFHHRVNANDICLHLGAFCGKSISSTDRYLDLMLNDTIWNKQTVDYYLCSLLLDKNVSEFHKKLPLYYNLSDTVPNAYDALPRSYKEALLLMSDEEYAIQGKIVIGGDSLATLSDTLYASRFREYTQLKNGISDMRIRVNKSHREFGKNYWWYFDFSDKGNGELSLK